MDSLKSLVPANNEPPPDPTKAHNYSVIFVPIPVMASLMGHPYKEWRVARLPVQMHYTSSGYDAWSPDLECWYCPGTFFYTYDECRTNLQQRLRGQRDYRKRILKKRTLNGTERSRYQDEIAALEEAIRQVKPYNVIDNQGNIKIL